MSSEVFDFSINLRWRDIPPEVQHQAKRCLLDLIGVAAAGKTTKLSAIISDHAAEFFGAGNQKGARLFFDGRRVSAAGAALANGMTIDAMDAHDGHPLTKGHAGCGLLPALVALVESEELEISGEEFLTTLIVGYEVAIRAGIALHETVPDYHTSGAWVSIGIVAMAARLLDMSEVECREAMGIAEYHGPRSQMMRVIDHPAMLKDGSGWGAMAGVSAVYLARAGFTGAPAITVEAPEVIAWFSDLGTTWRSMEQYFKPYPVCRWAQPPMEAVFQLLRDHDFVADDIDAIEAHTFYEAYRLSTPQPKTTEEAQYSLPFSVAAALVTGKIGPEEVGEKGLSNPAILVLAGKVQIIEDKAFSAAFPAERWAKVVLTLKDGQRLISEPAIANGNAENPLSDDVLNEKFSSLIGTVDNANGERIKSMIWGLNDQVAMTSLMSEITTA